eukprot:15395112-Alexandrium_andersonii.AAC.1
MDMPTQNQTKRMNRTQPMREPASMFEAAVPGMHLPSPAFARRALAWQRTRTQPHSHMRFALQAHLP